MTFLLSFLVLLVLAYTAHCQTCSDFDADVLILGGGMAGVSAANRLAELGITDFIILESQDRLGGRMRTEELVPGVNVDVGTLWIHGIDRNNPRLHPLYDLAARCAVESLFTDYENITTYYSNRTKVNETYLGLRFDAYSKAFDTASKTFRNAPNANQNTSVRSGLTKGGWTPNSPEDDFVDWYEFDFYFADTPNETALLSAVNDSTLTDFLQNPNNDPEDIYITNSRGHASLLKCLANNFSTNPETDERIRLSTMVTKIEYSDECVCATATQDNEERTYCAPYAIVTFSNGVLKEGATTLFSPDLPKAKINALNFIVMAFYHTIYAVYDERFWDNNEFIGHVHSNRGYFPIIQTVPSQEVNAVLFHVVDYEAVRLTSLPEDEIKEEITAVFRSIYKDNVTEPSKVLSFPWATDPSFLGSFTNIKTGGGFEMIEELGKAEGRLHFAGEGTISKYYSYSHGAYLSGIEKANDIQQQRMSSGAKLAGNIVAIALTVLCAIMVMN